MPTDSYKKLLTTIIKRSYAVTESNRKSTHYVFPNDIEDNFIMNAFFRLEVMTLLGIQWSCTYENEELKSRLSRDLILWHKNENPDALFTLTNEFF